MKKIIITSIATFTIVAAKAQGDSEIDRSVFNAFAAIFVMLAIMGFILAIIKKIIDYRLKNKIVDKGISENIASSILQTTPHEGINANIKWFAILAGIGAGLMIVNYTQPLGFHSVAIMAFSISLSFLGYYFFIRKAGKQ
jgi:Fe2+ transport system protein B